MADGVIITAKADSNDLEARKGYGFYILIRHEGFYTLYGHMTGLIVKTGQQVKAGEVVGYLGNTGNSTGAHLHFEVRTGPAPDTAKDPAPYLIKDKLHDIAALVQKRYNFSDATMDYLTAYKFARDLLTRLAG